MRSAIFRETGNGGEIESADLEAASATRVLALAITS